MRKKIMLAMAVLGTSAMVNAQPTAVKTSAIKEVKMGKTKKENQNIDKFKLPKVVTETFITEFPVVKNENWFTYPKFDSEKDWYYHDPFLDGIANPEFFIVEFTQDNVKHKAIYSKSGKKIAVHKNSFATLPKIISEAISKSNYSTWKIAKENEEIFKDKEMDKLKTYKVIVEKGKEKHALYYSSTGGLLKDKVVI
jgi:aconitase A